MLEAGLVSVTFRPLSRAEVALWMKKASLSLIEWGGDVHVPPDAPDAVPDVLRLSEKYGLRTVSYGSYYRCDGNESFRRQNLRRAFSLGSPNLRVWAGTKGSGETDAAEREAVVQNLQKTCEEAVQKNGNEDEKARAEGRLNISPLNISAEFHGGTLTDNWESALRLVHEVERENFKLYWQPNQFRDDHYNRTALRAVLPYLSNVHVFTWRGRDRFPLAKGEAAWRSYLDILREAEGDHALLLEFVCDDTPDQFLRDAETLVNWLSR